MYALVKDSDGSIASISDAPCKQDGYTCVNLGKESISGDAVPSNKKEMTRGTLLGGVYTEPTKAVSSRPSAIQDLLDIDADTVSGTTLKVVVKALQHMLNKE